MITPPMSTIDEMISSTEIFLNFKSETVKEIKSVLILSRTHLLASNTKK